MRISDQALEDALSQVVSGVVHPANNFVISANYYDHQTPERFGERWYIAQIWLSSESAWNVAFTETGLLCDVKLNRHNLNQVSRILLPYDQIWSVQSISPKHLDLYHRTDKLNLKRPNDKE